MTLKPNQDIIPTSPRHDRRPDIRRSHGPTTTLASLSDSQATFLLSDLFAALSHALDVSEGHDQEHALRTCVIGMRIGERLGLTPSNRADLFYALLLKDLGASSSAAHLNQIFGRDDDELRRALRHVDFGRLDEGARFMLSHLGSSVGLSRRLRYLFDIGLGRFPGSSTLVKPRSERGAQFALDMGLSSAVATAILNASEHYDGSGGPRGLSGDSIPLLARIVALAQAAEQTRNDEGSDGVARLLASRAGSWFDPTVATALSELLERPSFWNDLDRDSVWHAITEVAPLEEPLDIDDERLDIIAEVFAKVIDAKSPWTHRHSIRVRDIAIGMLCQLPDGACESQDRRRALRRGALLHDIGTLGISNAVIDKSGGLTLKERESLRLHTAYSEHILSWTGPFKETVALAAGHHERLDGHGYHGAIPASLLDFDTRLLAVADQFEALTAARPHRDRFDPETALSVLASDAGSGIDPAALAALERYLSSPAASGILAPPQFDPEQLVVIA